MPRTPVAVLFPDYFDLRPGTPLLPGSRVVLHGEVVTVLPGRHCERGDGGWFERPGGGRYCFVCGDVEPADGRGPTGARPIRVFMFGRMPPQE